MLERKQVSFEHGESPTACTEIEVVIEIPKWSFLKRGTSGRVDFVSPFPCPFNYGSVPQLVGLDGDLLDALVLGPRLRRGTRITVPAHGAVGLSERGLYDDKLVASHHSPGRWQVRGILVFFHFYALCKGLLNVFRGYRKFARCEGWGSAAGAIGRSTPRDASWTGPKVPY